MGEHKDWGVRFGTKNSTLFSSRYDSKFNEFVLKIGKKRESTRTGVTGTAQTIKYSFPQANWLNFDKIIDEKPESCPQIDRRARIRKNRRAPGKVSNLSQKAEGEAPRPQWGGGSADRRRARARARARAKYWGIFGAFSKLSGKGKHDILRRKVFFFKKILWKFFSQFPFFEIAENVSIFFNFLSHIPAHLSPQSLCSPICWHTMQWFHVISTYFPPSIWTTRLRCFSSSAEIMPYRVLILFIFEWKSMISARHMSRDGRAQRLGGQIWDKKINALFLKVWLKI